MIEKKKMKITVMMDIVVAFHSYFDKNYIEVGGHIITNLGYLLN